MTTPLNVRLWWWASVALYRVGLYRAYGWAHVHWLQAHTRAVQQEDANA